MRSGAAIYWLTLACITVVEAVSCAAMILAWQSVFAAGVIADFDGILRNAFYGAAGGVLTALFVMLATLPLLRSLGERKGAFVALSAVGPLVGWMLVGVVESGVVGVDNTLGWAVVSVVASVGSCVIAVLATFVIDAVGPGNDDSAEDGSLNHGLDDLGFRPNSES
ncbi:hypothetical protein [Microbacterium sp. RG1]|uniref:hypothetical protein n=1 Tax=Microbacterium sp. RG1 TaxID=2489212 RepID=UPI0010CA3B3F|nr:hypothetical protein [Microbacterium sp. RG1]QCQ16882.1 hypothetical protein EHF32_09205 [Microbacterium sp. RG1]